MQKRCVFSGGFRLSGGARAGLHLLGGARAGPIWAHIEPLWAHIGPICVYMGPRGARLRPTTVVSLCWPRLNCGRYRPFVRSQAMSHQARTIHAA